MLSNPRLWVSGAAGLLPMMAAGGVAGVAVKGVGLIASWGLADAALAESVAAGTTVAGRAVAAGTTTATFAGSGLKGQDALINSLPLDQAQALPGYQRARDAIAQANPGREAEITDQVIRDTLKRSASSSELLQHTAIAGMYLATGGTSELFARSLGVGVAEKMLGRSLVAEAAQAGAVGFAQGDLAQATSAAAVQHDPANSNPFSLAAETAGHVLDKDALASGTENAFIGALAGPVQALIAR